ncbi:MAG: maltose acetyltransferase domain-containing protein [Coprococcus phoceensis]
MSEKEKMLAGQLYNHYDKQLTIERKEIAEKVYIYNNTRDLDKQQELLSTMLGKVGNNVEIKVPFMCDYGYNIEMGGECVYQLQLYNVRLQ